MIVNITHTITQSYNHTILHMVFENLEINTRELPAVETANYQQLSRSYLGVRYISNAIFFIILLMGVFVLYRETDISAYPALWYGLLTFWMFWFLVSLFLVKKGYDIRGYVLREHDIIHRKGVLVKSLTTVPFNRVQHCEISQGPIQRLFNLHTLEIFTAGGGKSDLSIPGLEGETAQQIKEFIVKKTEKATEPSDSSNYNFSEFEKE